MSRRLSTVLAAALTAVLAVGTAVVAPEPAHAATETYPAPASGAWTVEGHGYGHGRGLSQWGAQGRAQAGQSAAQILDFYYPGTTATTAGNILLRVGLVAYVPTQVAYVRPLAGEHLTYTGDRGGKAFTNTCMQAVKITIASSKITAECTDSVHVTLGYDAGADVAFAGSGGQGTGLFKGTGQTGTWYRGSIVADPSSASGFDVVNEVLMEEYLRGVVPHESPASWESAALQAQAVAARTYALYKAKHATGAIDICDTTTCQVYYGAGTVAWADGKKTSTEAEKTDDAIAATKKQVRYYDGAVAFTEFSSSNGGWTRAGDMPYQQAKADPYSGRATGDSVSSWTTTLKVADVQQSCPAGGRLSSIVVLKRDGNGDLGGRVSQVRLDCSNGSVTLNNPQFTLRSTWWKPLPTTPKLSSTRTSATSIANGGKVTMTATPNLDVTWTLTVRDARTNVVAYTGKGSATRGKAFSATWPGTTTAGARVGAGPYTLALSATSADGAKSGTYRSTVQVGKAADPAKVAAVPLVGKGGYVPLTPTRLVDSRATFQSLGAQQRVDLQVAGKVGVPTAATAVVLNVTAVNASTYTHFRMWPAGAAMPDASVLNTDSARTQATTVTVGVGGGGKVSLYNQSGTVHYVVDVLGYYTTDLAGAARYTAVDPVRAYDSRTAGSKKPVSPGTAVTVQVGGKGGVPSSARAVTVNVTAAKAAGPGYLVAYGSGAMPATSTVNLLPGGDVSNRATVPVVDGKITIKGAGSATHVVVDVVGWYGAAGASQGQLFTPIQPVRLRDTRVGSPIGAGKVRDVGAVTSASRIPSGATAMVGTVVIVEQTAPVTHLRLWPTGRPLTETSDVNGVQGHTQANAVAVPLGTGGKVSVYNNLGSTHVVLDATGYFS